MRLGQGGWWTPWGEAPAPGNFAGRREMPPDRAPFTIPKETRLMPNLPGHRPSKAQAATDWYCPPQADQALHRHGPATTARAMTSRDYGRGCGRHHRRAPGPTPGAHETVARYVRLTCVLEVFQLDAGNPQAALAGQARRRRRPGTLAGRHGGCAALGHHRGPHHPDHDHTWRPRRRCRHHWPMTPNTPSASPVRLSNPHRAAYRHPESAANRSLERPPMTITRAPADLDTAGRKLWRDILRTHDLRRGRAGDSA